MFQRRSSAPNSAFRRDHRLEDVRPARVAACARVVVEAHPEGVEVAHVPQLGGVLEVPSGAEGLLAGARDDEHEAVVLVAKALPRIVQLGIHGAIDGVVLLRAVVRQRHHVLSPVVAQRLVAHAASLFAAAAILSVLAGRAECVPTEAQRRIRNSGN